jgi:NAD(P)H-dependent FMN reductase
MKDFECQSYNGDVEGKSGIEPGAGRFQQKLLANDALILAAPEYNGSMPGYLKNTIDWVSRFRPQPFNERQVLLMSASPSMGGGSHGLWSLRIPLEHLGARVYPDMFSLAVAHKAFKDGNIQEPILAKRFEGTIAGFMELAEAQKNYPCAKTAWVEFLGEKTDSVTDRVEK